MSDEKAWGVWDRANAIWVGTVDKTEAEARNDAARWNHGYNTSLYGARRCGHCQMVALRARHDLVVKRESELHYAIRNTAPMVDTKLTEEEAHLRALDLVKSMRNEIGFLRRALASIGKNTCGHEPLAAAYARGVLAEMS
jgi:hypothetical protein